MLHKIIKIIPKRFHKKSLRYLLLSLLNVFLDLVSIAYLIPLFIFLLDKEQMPSFLKNITFFNEQYVGYWVTGIVLLFVVKNTVQVAIIRFQTNLVFQIATTLSARLSKQFLRKPFLELQQIDKGKEIQKIQMAGTDFANHILLSINTFFTEILVLGSMAVVSFVLYPKFTVYIFIITLICLVVLYRFRKKKIDYIGKSIRETYSLATSHLLNIIDGFLEIKSLGKERFFQEQYQKNLARFNSFFSTLKKHQNSNAKFMEIFIIIGLSLFLFYINRNISNTSSKVVLISFVAGISLKLFPSINKLIVAYTNFKSYQYTLAVFSNISEKNNETKQAKYSFNSTLVLKNVSFSYTQNQTLLKDIFLTLKKGEITGIKGRSGIGKTTLLNLIMGLLTPQQGAIFLDGKPIKHSKNTLLNFIGYVPQQPFLFQGTLLENITMDEQKNKIDFTKIKYLVKALDLENFVHRLPQGLNTALLHDSLQVSGGQKQRIALVRALYANPQLLILDEVTNQLDEELEKRVLSFLKKYTKQHNIATVIVSHAPAMQTICDAVFVISQHQLIKQTI